MNFNDYQELAHRTSAFTPSQKDLRANVSMAVLGLNGEAGEVADLIKKWLYHGHQLNGDKLANEIGDVLWYVAEICTAVGFELNDIAEGNIYKLRQRYPEGFSSEASINRRD